MLVLTVLAGNGLTMTLDNGERVRVKIVRVNGNKVRLGIDAPPDVDINRDDVQQRIDNGESFATTGHDGPSDMDGPHDAAATDGPLHPHLPVSESTAGHVFKFLGRVSDGGR